MRTRRDEINQEAMQQRMQMASLEDQIMTLQREKQRIALDVETKDNQIKRYTTLIEQSDEALNKMIQNTQKLSDTLSSALNNNL